MIFDIFRHGFSIDLLINLCARIFVIFCILPVHEFAHAFSAHLLGDDTAKRQGRLTMNPLAHLDLWGSLLILLAGFGYAKPVPINPTRFKRPKLGMAVTAVAGPISNLLMAFVFLFLFALVEKSGIEYGTFSYAFAYFLMYACQINLSLAVFNLLPIPPLDGSRLLEVFIPDRIIFKYARYERYLVYAVLLLVLVGALDTPIEFCVNGIYDLFYNIISPIVGV